MSIFNSDKLSKVTITDPRKVFLDILKTSSGSSYTRDIKYNIFYRIIGFKGAVPGVGCSTIVANTAIALADLGLTVCVFDTSMMHPVQDELLKTDYKSKPRQDRLDWLDIHFNEMSPLNISKINKNISVLSFAGKNRTVLDMMGTLENQELITTAIDKIQDKFDLILIDLCEELTEVNTTALQKSQSVIQVWSDSLSCLASMDRTITNNVVLSCPMDKMRFVVENKMCDDVIGDLDALYKQYRFKKIAHCRLSYSIARVENMGKVLWQYPTDDEEIIEFTNCIIAIACHICNIDTKEGGKGTITSQDIEDGKVKGTLHNKQKKGATPVEIIAPDSMLDEKLDLGFDDDSVSDDFLEEGGKSEKSGLFGKRKK